MGANRRTHHPGMLAQGVGKVNQQAAAAVFETLESHQADQSPATSRPERPWELPADEHLLPEVHEELLEELIGNMPGIGR